MTLLANISVTELSPLLNLVHESTAIKRHFELFNWLQNQVQRFIPHDILITAWGDFSLGLICHDIVSPLTGMRTDAINDKALLPFLSVLFSRWDECDQAPYIIRSEDGFYHEQLVCPVIAKTMASMRCGLVHGIKDQRGNHDCLYVFLGPAELSNARTRESLRFLLPFIDTAFRRISPLSEQLDYATLEQPKLAPVQPIAPISPVSDTGSEWALSGREAEIMHWVSMGKTNQEIGQILNISSFTVKNHLQRIFKKLNVSNRAQAVSKNRGHVVSENRVPVAPENRARVVSGSLVSANRSQAAPKL